MSIETGDPVLQAYTVTEGVYTIAGWFHPSTIRDQVLRACLLVDRIVPTIEAKDSIVIVGGGVAGVAAACRASEHKLHVKLLEREMRFIGRQLGCQTRFLDPCQYDWPSAYHRGFPQTLSLPLLPGPANELSNRWEYLFTLARREGFVEAVKESEVIDVVTDRRPMVVRVRNKDGETKTHEATRIIICIGFGDEICSIPGSSFGGFGFWENDPFPAPDIGTGKPQPDVLVSGGGDGALQDFIRIVSGMKSAKDVYESLGGINDRHELQIYSVDDQSQRAYAWSRRDTQAAPTNLDSDVLRQIHERFASVVDDLFRDRYGQLQSWFRDRLGLRVAGLGRVRLVFDAQHFTRSYALNRFLVLLLAHALEEFGQHRHRQVMHPSTKLVGVSPIGPDHVCCSDAWECSKFAHRAQFINSAGVSTTDDFDLIVIRHG
jgi:Pyridine nucleotide-disulphide oxidoreductase